MGRRRLARTALLPESWRYGSVRVRAARSESSAASSRPRERDLRLDLLRGLCLFKMVLNHLWTTPLHVIHLWTGFVTAAGGFFFLSGAIVGIVHGRRVEVDGMAATGRALLSRAGQIYLANLGLVLLLASLEAARVLSTGYILQRFRLEGWPSLFDMHQEYYLQVLPRYVVFLAIAPLALWLLRRGHGWVMVSVSVAVWAANLLTRGGLTIPWAEDPRSTAFAAASWQLLFFVGLAVGYHRERIAPIWRRAMQPRWVVMAMTAVAIGFAWFHHSLVSGDLVVSHEMTQRWLERDLIAPARVLNLVVVFALLFWLVDRCWVPIARAAGWLLIPFGRHALYLYLVHVPVHWLGVAAFAGSAIPLHGESWRTVPFVVAAIALFWAMIRYRVGFRVIPT